MRDRLIALKRRAIVSTVSLKIIGYMPIPAAGGLIPAML
jgi:hypothetical protein